MKKTRIAFLDLGTNTFHCKIIETKAKKDFNVIFYEKTFVKIGASGFDKRAIDPDAVERAINCLKTFQKSIDNYDCNTILVNGTSALRSLKNTDSILSYIRSKKWQFEIIDGLREAELIYKGVLLDDKINMDQCSLIMDIGGGSVEFIIAEKDQMLWSESIEIGAQRLKDKFHRSDLISRLEIENLETFLKQELRSLLGAIKKFNPKTLIGCSGTFETHLDILNSKSKKNFVSKDIFTQNLNKLIASPLKERLNIPGLNPERATMIVVASILLNYILAILKFEGFQVSSNSMKEGMIYEFLESV